MANEKRTPDLGLSVGEVLLVPIIEGQRRAGAADYDCDSCADDDDADQCHECSCCPHRCECPCEDCGMPFKRCTCHLSDDEFTGRAFDL